MRYSLIAKKLRCAVLMQQIVKSAGQGEGPQVVMVLTHLTATQPHLTELPKSVIKVSTLKESEV